MLNIYININIHPNIQQYLTPYVEPWPSLIYSNDQIYSDFPVCVFSNPSCVKEKTATG